MRRSFTCKTGMIPCPKCGNATQFTANSERCAEDCCEVWVSCEPCGFAFADRREDVWGSLDNESVQLIAADWNEAARLEASNA